MFNAGYLCAIKNPFRVFLLRKYEDTVDNTLQVNLWEAFSITCFAGSEFPAGSSCSFQRTLLFFFVSLMYLKLQLHCLSEITQDRYATLSLSGNKDLMFLINHKTISIILPLVKLSILLINFLTSCSLLGQ